MLQAMKARLKQRGCDGESQRPGLRNNLLGHMLPLLTKSGVETKQLTSLTVAEW